MDSLWPDFDGTVGDIVAMNIEAGQAQATTKQSRGVSKQEEGKKRVESLL